MEFILWQVDVQEQKWPAEPGILRFNMRLLMQISVFLWGILVGGKHTL